MKLGLLLNVINPAIGGVLLRGERGTAKSTAVRTLTQILPLIHVVDGCRFNCDPNDPERLCDECRARVARGEKLHAVRREMRTVELPINASEDRVIGSIDIEAAITKGERRFEPGVLAAANRNILYVDEVNLLDDHLVDVLLDAAAMGLNVVEREGVAIMHPARFVLVGTMNPHEGELRPQLLDRFGLCVDIEGLRNVDDRVLVMERNAEQELRAQGALHENEKLRAVIAGARELLPFVEVSPQIRWFIALLCVDAGVSGHRADIVISRAAETYRALLEAQAGTKPGEAIAVTVEDVAAVADLALAHRRRNPAATQNRPSSGENQENQQRMQELAEQAESETMRESPPDEENEPVIDESDQSEEGGDSSEAQDEGKPAQPKTAKKGDVIFSGDVFNVKSIKLPRERKVRNVQGKRNTARTSTKRGRYVRSIQAEHPTDIALDATIRAAAPHQITRKGEHALNVHSQDIRQKVRRKRTGTLIVFVVDDSASMDAEQRMQATKGAVLSLLHDAYVRRDKVALVTFSGRSAKVTLPPTNSVDLAETKLQSLAVGGTTPLTHGLAQGLELIRNARRRDATVHPLLVLISDGRGNISLYGEEPIVEARALAAQIAQEHIQVLVIDSARDYIGPQLPTLPAPRPGAGGYGFNACLDLAERAGGEYLGLYDLSQSAIVAGVQRTLSGR